MIELKVNDYYKVLDLFQNVDINTLFAKSIIYRQIPGAVYADNDKEPSTFYIAHPYGMSLLLGSTENKNFNTELYHYMVNKNNVRKKNEWLQVFPNTWNDVIKAILGSLLVINEPINNEALITKDIGNKVIENTRINFTFDNSQYRNVIMNSNTPSYEIVKTTKEMFCKIQGSVIPKYYWSDEEQFDRNGIGFSSIYDGEIAATAFSAFRYEKQLEIGIETLEKYRGKGFAFKVCSTLIDYCLKNNLEPIWSCRKENEGSYKLAQSLGFVPTISIPYYRLVV